MAEPEEQRSQARNLRIATRAAPEHAPRCVSSGERGWGYDAKLLAALTREVLAFYTRRMAKEGIAAGQSGAVVVIQRTPSDLKLPPSGIIDLLSAFSARQ